MNSIYHSAIKAIPYDVVFNRKPNYKRVDPPLRPIFTEDDIKEHVIDDEQDDSLTRDEQRQLEVETRLREEVDVDEVDMTGTIASSGLTSLGPDYIISEYAGSLPEDPYQS